MIRLSRLLKPAQLFCAGLALAAPGAAQSSSPFAVFSERASVNSVEMQGNAPSRGGDITADGRYVVFDSTSNNLDAWDTSPQSDVFVRDYALGETKRISLAAGTEPNGESRRPSISADGRYVVMESKADNLVSGDTNGAWDVFLWERQTNVVRRLSVRTDGTQANGDCLNARISANGSTVVYESRATNLADQDTSPALDIYVHVLANGETRIASLTHQGVLADRECRNPAISADGTRVAWDTDATNMVFWDTNGHSDVYVRELATDLLWRASLGSVWTEGDGPSRKPTLSPDGRKVAFESAAATLVPGDTNYQTDIFVRDLQLQVTQRISVSTAGAEGQLPSTEACWSSDGRWVSFLSEAWNFVAGDVNNFTDVFVRDMALERTVRVSRGRHMTETSNHARAQRISGSGRWVVYETDAFNIVPGDTNGCADVFRVDWMADLGLETATYCEGKLNSAGCVPQMGWTGTASLSAGSGFVIEGHNWRNQKLGRFIYSVSGPDARPFFGGTLCVKSTIYRGPTVSSGGNAGGNDCSGVLRLDFNRFLAGQLWPQPAPALLHPGTTVYAQWYGRDNGLPLPNNINLSDGLRFVIQP